MEFYIDPKTMAVIEEMGGNFFAKSVMRYTRLGSYVSLWKGVLDPQKENLDNYRLYQYQNINIYVEKSLYVADIIAIKAGPKILFAPRFDIYGVATWPIDKDGSVIVKSSGEKDDNKKDSNQDSSSRLKSFFNFKEITAGKMLILILNPFSALFCYPKPVRLGRQQSI